MKALFIGIINFVVTLSLYALFGPLVAGIYMAIVLAIGIFELASNSTGSWEEEEFDAPEVQYRKRQASAPGQRT